MRLEKTNCVVDVTGPTTGEKMLPPLFGMYEHAVSSPKYADWPPLPAAPGAHAPHGVRCHMFWRPPNGAVVQGPPTSNPPSKSCWT